MSSPPEVEKIHDKVFKIPHQTFFAGVYNHQDLRNRVGNLPFNEPVRPRFPLEDYN